MAALDALAVRVACARDGTSRDLRRDVIQGCSSEARPWALCGPFPPAPGPSAGLAEEEGRADGGDAKYIAALTRIMHPALLSQRGLRSSSSRCDDEVSAGACASGECGCGSGGSGGEQREEGAGEGARKKGALEAAFDAVVEEEDRARQRELQAFLAQLGRKSVEEEEAEQEEEAGQLRRPLLALPSVSLEQW
jgi:hypothetical protein